MAKSKSIYIGKGFYEFGVKGMEERGAAIESITYPSVPKGTKIHGYENYCAIEQNGKFLGRKEETKLAAWVEDIEKLAPGIKGSFFGLGAYKNVTITATNSKGFKAIATASAKSANGVTCTFNDNMSVYIGTIDVKKFKAWMGEWGHQFGLKKKGNVWISKAEWQHFIVKMLLPFTFDSSIKTMKAPTTSTTYAITKSNAKTLYEEMVQRMKTYLANNLGLTVSIYFN